MRFRSCKLPLLAAAALAVAACRRESPAPEVSSPERPASAPAPSPWHAVGDAELRVVRDEGAQRDLGAAIARARETLDHARTLWQAQRRDAGAPPPGWAVQWRAPTIAGGTEYVWVEPMTWSTFRVEGRLASAPQHELACGKNRDEIVGFPAEELVDWVRYEHPDFTGTYDGGFTIAALER